MNATDNDPRGAEKARKKICFLVTEDWYFISHRLDFARRLVEAGFDVVVGCRFSGQESRIREAGIRAVDVPFTRESVSVFKAIDDIRHIRRFLCHEKPDIVHSVALRPILIGAIAGFGEKYTTVNAITGLGSLFSGGLQGWRFLVIGHIVRFFLRLIFRSPNTFNVFQNAEDMRSCIDTGITRTDNTVLIRGAGVDGKSWTPVPEQDHNPPIILYVGRLLKDKGIHELLQASQLLARRGCLHHLQLVGGPDPCNPNSLSESEISAYTATPHIEWLGRRENVLELMSNANIIVLPSYREGLPKVLLEAGLVARAVVTTDVVGCREIVHHERNGLLAAVRDPESLSMALERLLVDPAFRQALARTHHEVVKKEYSLEHVAGEFIQLYHRILGVSERQVPQADKRSIS